MAWWEVLRGAEQAPIPRLSSVTHLLMPLGPQIAFRRAR